MTIKSQVGEISRERRGQGRSEFKAGGGAPSYRHDPRRVVPVHNPLKHPELHSLIDTVTHLGGLETWGMAILCIQRFSCLIICSKPFMVHSDRQRNETCIGYCCRFKTIFFPFLVNSFNMWCKHVQLSVFWVSVFISIILWLYFVQKKNIIFKDGY